MMNKYLCIICTKSVNSIIQAHEHNKMKPHQRRFRARGLRADHDVETYLSENNLVPIQGISENELPDLNYIPKMEILRGKEALNIIQGQRSLGISIPLGVASVVRVHKLFDYKSNKTLFDKDGFISSAIEVIGSLVVIDADSDKVLGILVHSAIGEETADKFCREGLQLARSGGFVARAADKSATEMAMFGYRFAGSDFGRYVHPWEKRLKGETEVPKERLAKCTELDLYASIMAQDLHQFISSLFPSFSEALEGLYNEKEGLGRIGTTPYSTMGISEDYASGAHVDNQDFGFCFISWFLTRTSFPGKDVRAGGEFFLVEYGIYFQPRHGSILALNSKEVYHGTRQNIGFTQLGIALLAKKKVADGGAKRKRTIGLG